MPRSSQRPRLGRGLSSLIRSSTEIDALPAPAEYVPQPRPPRPAQAAPADTAAEAAPAGDPTQAATTVVMLPVDSIAPNPYQPRRKFSDDTLDGLADSIRNHGLLQPVLVAKRGDGEGDTIYHLIAGERRLRAAQRAGIAQMPCIVRPADRQQMLELAVVENIHRADLNPIERAEAYRSLIDRFGLTQQQVAERIGQPRASIANTLRMLDLCDSVQQRLIDGALSFGHAKVLAGLAGLPELQASLAGRAVAEGLSVRELEELVKAASQRAAPAETTPKRPGKSAYIEDLERQLTEAVGTRVAIRPGRGKHSGRMIIDYYTLDDFDRITARLGVQIDS